MSLRSLLHRGTMPRHDVSPFTGLDTGMHNLLRSFFGAAPFGEIEPWNLDSNGFSPSLEVVENDESVTVTAELPGVESKDVDVTVTEDTLTLRGEKKSESKSEKDNVRRVERSYGSFERVVPLPAEVVADKVTATFEKGVLTVAMPKSKTAAAKAKKIAIATK